MTRYVYAFGDDLGGAEPKELLGGKGAGLFEMTRLGIPVPPGFTISTAACRAYSRDGRIPDGLEAEVDAALARLEADVGKKLGDASAPLLVSVRSGAKFSMPGMMDTILNLGLNETTAEGLAKGSGDRRFAFDAYRRFVEMYASVVMGIERHRFEEALTELKRALGSSAMADHEVPAEKLEELVGRGRRIVADAKGPFPDETRAQLWGAIEAVFRSWNNPRAQRYRKMHDIPDDLGTAVNVQAMVFGNMGDDSGSGVAFTRNPSTGEKLLYGEFLPNAQGEDVVAGIRTPRAITVRAAAPGREHETLERSMPAAFETIRGLAERLEGHFRDLQDIEFTIEKGRVYLLQTRNGKRTAHAAVKVAVDMVGEKLLSPDEAILRVDASSLDQLLHATLPDPAVLEKRGVRAIASGLPASPGAAMGEIVLDADEAERLAGQGKKVILVRRETSPEDIHGMKAAQGIVTATGGMTCVAGETRVLTDRGLLAAEDAFGLLEQGETLRILSFDARTMRPVFRDVIAAGRKPADVIEVAVSQTGRAEQNVLRMTPDHKMVVLEKRELRKKPLERVLEDGDFVAVVDSVPRHAPLEVSLELAYVAGAILSDGYIRLRPTKGSVTFIQKPTPEKAEFIAAVEHAFERAFGVGFSYVRERETVGTLRGRTIRGSVEDRICFRREPASRLAAIRDDLPRWVLSLDETPLLAFLAGVVDGDGSYAAESSEVRLQVTVSAKKPRFLEGVVLACLRLGIVPQVTSNRDAFNVQIAERVADIVALGHRVKPDVRERHYESKCLAVRGLFEDIVDDVNFMGRVREGIKRNLMFGVEKIRRDVLPLCPPDAHRQVEALLGGSLRSHRIQRVGGPAPTDVFNFEVDARHDVDKNFVAFSSRLTPVLVSNSHAAVVARGLGKCCVAGVSAMHVDYEARKVAIRDETGLVELAPGDKITLDGTHGLIYRGELDVEAAAKVPELDALMAWADERRRLGVHANADTPGGARTARSYGAEGIGLCRTEHMFFAEDRVLAVRCMALAENAESRAEWLAKIEPMQEGDFAAMLEAMAGLPVTIRLLDWPLHEFMPKTDADHASVAKALGLAPAEVAKRAEDLHEINPMLGHRGVRLGLTTPEIYRMQARAIARALIQCTAKGVDARPKIMIPVVALAEELAAMRAEVVAEVERVAAAAKTKLSIPVGTMIELPRACLVAGDMARHADFFSFGTNDLTQTTFGISRDDAGRFLTRYVEDARGLLPADPFARLDESGVGELVRLACERGRATRADLELGVCGEHGGDPGSIALCHAWGIDYVSCSPPRLPIARLAAAQAAVRGRAKTSSTA